MAAQLVLILLSACLMISAREDYLNRSIRWFWVPLIAIGSFTYCAFEFNSILIPLENLWMNSLIILSMLGLVKLYFILKFQKITALVDQQIGWGDVLILLSITPMFHWKSFVLFLNATLLITLFGHTLCKMVKKSTSNLIPLVSYINLSLVVFLSIKIFFKEEWQMVLSMIL